jgi:acetylornithine/N-succinyldiaminopimelate aminotransferase
MHGTTFGGNPIACAAGSVVIDEVVDGGLMRNAAITGVHFLDQLHSLKAKHPRMVKDIRGKGLMIGCELFVPGKPIVDKLLDRGFIINCTHQTVLRFLPPLITQPSDIHTLCGALDQSFRELVP